MSARAAHFAGGMRAANAACQPAKSSQRRNPMNRIYAALTAVTLLASPAFAKSHHVVAKPAAVGEKAAVKGDAAKTDEAKPAEGEKTKPKKSTKKSTKKTEKTETAPEAAPAK